MGCTIEQIALFDSKHILKKVHQIRQKSGHNVQLNKPYFISPSKIDTSHPNSIFIGAYKF